MEELIKIENDLFDIAGRLREVDERYELFFNAKEKRFEVRTGGVLQVAVPFDRLDARTVGHVRKTRIENSVALLDEIDRANRAAEIRAARELADKACEAAENKEALCR